MVTRRLVAIVVVCLAAVALLAYLRDPPWLIDQTTGLRRWEQGPDGRRFRWSGAHASFFVPAQAGAIEVPLSTTFDQQDDRPMMVTISVDDTVAARVVLTGTGWTRARVTLPPRGTRRVRRIDVRTSVTRDDNHGVRIGELGIEPR